MNKEKIKKIQEHVIKTVLDRYDLDLEMVQMGEEVNIIGATKLTAKFATEETAKAILEDVEKRLNLLVNLNELEYMEVFVEKTKDSMTDKVVQGKIKALKGVAEEIKKEFGVK